MLLSCPFQAAPFELIEFDSKGIGHRGYEGEMGVWGGGGGGGGGGCETP